MNKIALIFVLLFSLVTTAQAARKTPEKNRGQSPSTEDSCSAVYGGCDDSYSSDDDQSSDATYTDRSETYEGNDRDTGSGYSDGADF